jgi:hypothetical protein
MSDLTAAVLAAITEWRRDIREHPFSYGNYIGWQRDNLDAWEAVVRAEPADDRGYTLHGAYAQWQAMLHIAARLFLAAEQQAEYGIELVPA